jgi:hypothetical protein
MVDDERRALIDVEHLRLLGLGYYVSAAITAFFSLFGLLYMGMGFMFGAIARNAPAGPDAPPEAMSSMFALFGGVIFLLTSTVAALKVYVARCLERRRRAVVPGARGVGRFRLGPEQSRRVL